MNIIDEIRLWWEEHYKGHDYPFDELNGHYIENDTVVQIAEHFYRIGKTNWKKRAKKMRVRQEECHRYALDECRSGQDQDYYFGQEKAFREVEEWFNQLAEENEQV